MMDKKAAKKKLKNIEIQIVPADNPDGVIIFGTAYYEYTDLPGTFDPQTEIVPGGALEKKQRIRMFAKNSRMAGNCIQGLIDQAQES